MKPFISIFQAIEEITSFESLIYRRSAWFIELCRRPNITFSSISTHQGNVIKDDIKKYNDKKFLMKMWSHWNETDYGRREDGFRWGKWENFVLYFAIRWE